MELNVKEFASRFPALKLTILFAPFWLFILNMTSSALPGATVGAVVEDANVDQLPRVVQELALELVLELTPFHQYEAAALSVVPRQTIHAAAARLATTDRMTPTLAGLKQPRTLLLIMTTSKAQ